MPFYKGHTYWDNENVKRTKFKKANLHPEKVKSLQYQLGTREKNERGVRQPNSKKGKILEKIIQIGKGESQR